MKSLILMGMKHCGKSTQGQHLARDMKRPFYDLDQEILNINPYREQTIRQLYKNQGSLTFQDLEFKAAKKIAEGSSRGETFVLSLGGGTINNTRAMEVLKESGLLLYLSEEESVLWERISLRGIPPFLDPEKPRESFQKLYHERTSLYTAAADITADIRGCNQDEAYKKIRETLKESAYAW